MKKPLPKERSTPKDVFAHLLATVTLAMSVIAFTTIWFQVVNIYFPDPLNYAFRAIDLIRSMIATVFVGWPIYLFLAWIIKKDIVANPDKQNIRVRKWLMYLTLFVASIVLIVNLVTLINGFLGGELTTRFALKVLAVFVAAGSVFGYYLWDVRRDVSEKTEAPMAVAVISTVFILATILAGFIPIGSPVKQRQIRLDDQRVSHLSEMKYQIRSIYTEEKRLPDSLNFQNWYILPTDPETGMNYDYRKINDTQFELCATFKTESSDSKQYTYDSRPIPYTDYGFLTPTNWNHGIGRTCFAQTIDPNTDTIK